MGLDTTLSLITTITVIAGVTFAVFEVLHMGARRRQNAAFALVQSYETTEFAKAIVKVATIPDGLSRRQLEEHLKDDVDGVYLMMTTWESLGILVYRREIDIELVEDFFSGPIAVSWRKFRPLIEEMRTKLDRETYFEWFQWLAERIDERESSLPAIPAQIEHRAWKP
jgi:hypothetical protein